MPVFFFTTKKKLSTPKNLSTTHSLTFGGWKLTYLFLRQKGAGAKLVMTTKLKGLFCSLFDLNHKQLLPPMFPCLFSTSNQMHSYDTRTAKSYRPHVHTNLKQFTFFTRALKIGILSLYRSLVRLAFQFFKKK